MIQEQPCASVIDALTSSHILNSLGPGYPNIRFKKKYRGTGTAYFPRVCLKFLQNYVESVMVCSKIPKRITAQWLYVYIYMYIFTNMYIYIYTYTNLYKYIHPHYIHIISPYCPMQSPFLPLKPKFFTIFVGKKHTIWACEVQGNQLCLWSAQWPRETRSVRCQRTDFLSFFRPPWRGFTKEFDVDLSLIHDLSWLSWFMTELILFNYGLWSSRNIEETSKHNLGVNIVPLKKQMFWYGIYLFCDPSHAGYLTCGAGDYRQSDSKYPHHEMLGKYWGIGVQQWGHWSARCLWIRFFNGNISRDAVLPTLMRFSAACSICCFGAKGFLLVGIPCWWWGLLNRQCGCCTPCQRFYIFSFCEELSWYINGIRYINGISTVYQRYINGISTVYQRYIDGISTVYQRYINGISTVYQRYINGISTVYQRYINGISTVYQRYINGISTVYQRYINGISTVYQRYINGISTVYQRYINGISTVYQRYISGISTVYQRYINGISTVYQRYINGISTVYQRYINGISTVYQRYINGISTVYQRYINGISTVYQRHINGISTVYQRYINGISTVYHRYINGISTVYQRYINGISTVYQRYINGISTVYQRYINGISTVYQRYINGISTVYQRYINGISTVYQRYINGISPLPCFCWRFPDPCSNSGAERATPCFTAAPRGVPKSCGRCSCAKAGSRKPMETSAGRMMWQGIFWFPDFYHHSFVGWALKWSYPRIGWEDLQETVGLPYLWKQKLWSFQQNLVLNFYGLSAALWVCLKATPQPRNCDQFYGEHND